MEFGVPQDDAADVGGIDTVPAGSLPPGGECYSNSFCAPGWTCTSNGSTAGTCVPPSTPHIFRWNLVRQYDAQRRPGASQPTNIIAYSWSKLSPTTLSGGTGAVGTALISDLTDIYDTPPIGAGLPVLTQYYAHHTHLIYNTSLGTIGSSTRADRALHSNFLNGVDVTSQTFDGSWATGGREQVRRYILSYVPEGHDLAVSQVLVDGWCSSNSPKEGAGYLLAPESASGPPACGVGPGGTSWPPATAFTYSNQAYAGPKYTPTLASLAAPPFTARPPTPPAILDLNSDGMPDLVDQPPAPPTTTTQWQAAWLNSAPPATGLNTWTFAMLTLSSGPLNATAALMAPSNPGYASAAILNDSHVNAIFFDPNWNNNLLTAPDTNSVGASVYSPRQMSPSTYDWGAPAPYTLTSINPGVEQNCTVLPGPVWNPGPDPQCEPGSTYLGSDKPFVNIDVDGDGLQDLIVSSVYGSSSLFATVEGTMWGDQSSYSVGLNANFTQRDATGVVHPFAASPLRTIPAIAGYGGISTLNNVLNDQPNICVGPSGASNDLLFSFVSTFGDINGDGLPDIIGLASDHFTVWYGHGDGVFGVCADGTTECSCADAGPTTFSTTASSQWQAAWSPLGSPGFQALGYDPKLVAQFHDVDGDGFDDAIVPSADGFDVYFIVTRTGTNSKLHVNAEGSAGFGWPWVNQPAYIPNPTPNDAGMLPILDPVTPNSDSAYMFADIDGSGVQRRPD